VTKPDLRDRLQDRLGDAYVIERELGGGGMSRVFVATEKALGRRVVVKVLPAEMAGEGSIERFRREISIAARLQHAHVVPLLTAGEVDGLPYFIMPFVDGESLRVRLEGHGELPLSDAVRILREVASALAYAHAHDVVHRDMKPENVLLSGGAAMVTDFGVAKAVNAAATTGGHGLTSAGVALGTPAYMAPEQASADPMVDSRADVYSWGVLAYELITGRSPFAGRNPQAMLAAHIAEVPEHVTRRRATIPPALAALVMRCLEKRPADRPQSAEELVRVLDDIGASGGHTAAPAAVLQRSSMRPRIVLAAAVLVAAGIVAWSALRHRSGAPAATAAPSLAVLPIENVGGDSTKEYLADGMTSELAGNLRQTPGLQVVGDLSTSRFKHSQLSPTQIAQQLGVGMLVTGKLQSQRASIRLQMQLIDAAGTLLWSKQFDREMKDNFALQDEVAAAIAGEMRLVLTPATSVVAHAGRTENAEAHDLFMRGQFEKNKLDAAGLKRAETYFKQALKLDPDYAQAHAGLAFAYDIQADVYAPSHEYHTLALKEARLAVAADSLLAEGRVLLGFEMAAANWDFEAGVAEMNRGLALNPSSADALFMAAGFSLLSGNTTRALSLTDSLIQVDPLSPLGPHARAEALLWAGRWQEALQQKLAAKKLDPTVTLFDVTDATALRELGRLNEALAAYLDFRKIADVPSFGLVTTYQRMGRHDDAMREIRAMEEKSRTQWVDPNVIALSYAGIGDRDNAMKWLEKAFEMKTYCVRLFMNWDMPWLRNMQDDPRYVALRKRVLASQFKE
jgi:serine/threonine-protein kinase